jgi:hypothetical protein
MIQISSADRELCFGSDTPLIVMIRVLKIQEEG